MFYTSKFSGKLFLLKPFNHLHYYLFLQQYRFPSCSILNDGTYSDSKYHNCFLSIVAPYTVHTHTLLLFFLYS